MASIDARLQRAQEAALRSDERLRNILGAVSLAFDDALIEARAILTIEGASSLEITLHDPDWRVEESGLLDRDDDGRLGTVDVVLDTLAYRLAQARRGDPDTLQLTFEDRAVQLLRAHTSPLSASRGSTTRAKFIEKMVREVKTHPIPFESPEKGTPQPRARPDYPDPAPGRSESGFDPDVRLTVKGVRADDEQKRQIETALTVADQEGAGPKATLALIVAGIGESGFRRSATQPQTKAHGVFQLIPSTARALSLDPEDTAATARHFLRHGYYRYGGAIKLARENASMSVGEIVSKVEGSDAAGGFYQAYADEAREIVSLWNKGSSTDTASDDVVRIKAYQFTRGLPDGKREDSFEAATRLAEEVNWRFYIAAGVAAFIGDDRLMTNRAVVAIDNPRDPGLLDRPTYDWDHGKLAGEVEIRVNADRWSIPPGGVWALRGGFGPVEGRWIAHTIEQNLLDSTDTTVTLIKPLPPRKEPAPETDQGGGSSSGSGSSSPASAASNGKITTAGGARGIVEQAADLASSAGGKDVYVGSDYRAGATTTSGNVSDHASNDRQRAARDVGVKGINLITGPPSPKLDTAVVAVGKAFGRNYGDGKRRIVDTFRWKGYQVQIIWRTPEYGGHMGHIHIGAHAVA